MPDDLRRLARALGEPDDDVRAAAEAALAALGPAAAGELIATVAWGRRRARDRAAALLADLPVTPAALDRLVDAELDALDADRGRDRGAARARRRAASRAGSTSACARSRTPCCCSSRRAAGRRAIARAAVAWRHARGAHERARTLAVIETALPRALVGRLVEAVDDLAPADRAAALVARRRARCPRATPSSAASSPAAIASRARSSCTRSAPPAAARIATRSRAPRTPRPLAAAASPLNLLRRLHAALDTDPSSEERTDMPTRVETLIALGRVPLLAALTTRQLADVAERARWVTARDGRSWSAPAIAIDALIVVDDGELALGDRRIGKGEVVDELACVAPLAAPGDLRVVAPARVIRLERVDFEELVDDVPGLASAVCRALGERARRAEDAAYRSPLASRQ